MNRIPYCTVEDIKAASDVRTMARDDQIVRAICGAADAVDMLTRRKFYPQLRVRYFDWPSGQYSRSWRLWLDQDQAIRVDSIGLRGTPTTINSNYYLLEPANSGPPYSRIEIDITTGGATATFGGSGGTQRAIVVSGLWGYDDRTALATTLVSSISGSSGSNVLRVLNSSALGVGSLVDCEGEKMLVTGRSFEDVGMVLDEPLAAQANATLFTVSGAGSLFRGETVMIGGEKFRIEEVFGGGQALVKRAQEGTPLAQHSAGDPVWAPRLLQVDRAAAGTGAVSHDAGAALARQVYPALIQQLAIAEAQVNIAQEIASYGRVIGSGDNTRESSGKGLDKIRVQVEAQYGRTHRTQAV